MTTEVQQLAGRCLSALNDERVMIPSNGAEAISDLKSILRRLIAGQLVLADAPPVTAAPPLAALDADEGSETK